MAINGQVSRPPMVRISWSLTPVIAVAASAERPRSLSLVLVLQVQKESTWHLLEQRPASGSGECDPDVAPRYARHMGGRARARGHLPAELSSFVGRRLLIQKIKTSLAGSRLVTLVGPGGVGKTRLALRTAADLERGVADGVWLVELGGLTAENLVPKAVMTSLGLRDESGLWPLSRLIDHLSAKGLLLVLDNCEHLLDACAVLTDSMLREAPDLRVLATSRQPLGVSGEQVVHVDPLTVPAAGTPFVLARTAQAEAVALLVERAHEAGADLVLTDATVADVVELVRRLDGIPLAIELAAVRLRALSPSQLTERLNDRFRLLRAHV
jgi:predicted ATPase